MVEPLRPIDVLILNGDLIDGDGARSGGSELITTDRLIQCDMVVDIVSYINPKTSIVIYGTPYHCGNIEDFELAIAKLIGASKIGGHEWIDVNGLIFDCKHFISNTSVPYSKGMSIQRDRVWNVLWAELENSQPKADVIIRSHLHSFCYTGGSNYLCIVTPALQGSGTKFGSRRCSQTVDFGIVYFDVNNKDDWDWSYDIRVVNSQKIEPYKV
jgi:hypothetical protein